MTCRVPVSVPWDTPAKHARLTDNELDVRFAIFFRQPLFQSESPATEHRAVTGPRDPNAEPAGVRRVGDWMAADRR